MKKVVLLALLISAPAFAAVNSTGNARASKPGKFASTDPNRVVCLTENVTGSRLGAKKVCRTATEWDQDRRDIRRTIDRVQANKTWDQNTDTYLRGLTGGH